MYSMTDPANVISVWYQSLLVQKQMRILKIVETIPIKLSNCWKT